MLKQVVFAAVLALLLVAWPPAWLAASSPYGVFIGLSPEDADKLAGHATVVIDAAYFTAEQVGALRQNGQAVYTYLNVGSLEQFRDYYARYQALTLGPYENWPDERWVDVTEPAWQDFVCAELAGQLAAKGVSGFFIDNLDVYYQYQDEAVYQALVGMLSRLAEYGLDLVANGGDTLVEQAMARGDLERSGLDGVNQECVLSAIDFAAGSFERQTTEDSVYFTDYLAACKLAGLRVFVTEYADPDNLDLRGEIAAFCAANAYTCYISSGLELDGR